MAYNLLKPVHIIDAGDMATSITSAAVEVMNQDNVGIQLKWTGTPTGTFDVEISMDHKEDSKGNIIVPGNFIPLTLSPAITAAGSADDAYIDLNQLSAMYVRIVYTAGSGAGTLDVYVAAKGV